MHTHHWRPTMLFAVSALLLLLTSSFASTPVSSAPPLAGTANPLTCRASGGSGGLPPGEHDIEINGQPVHLVVGKIYDPSKPTHLAFFLHGDSGRYKDDYGPIDGLFPYTPMLDVVNQAGWIYVAPQVPGTPTEDGFMYHPWAGGANSTLQQNTQLLRDTFEYVFAKYNVCEDVMFGASVSGGSYFYDLSFFPRSGGDYPAFVDVNCGASGFTSRSSAYSAATTLSQNPNAVARSELHYTIGTRDFLYDEFLLSSATYGDLGFNVATNILQNTGHCTYEHSKQTAAYWRSKAPAFIAAERIPATITVASGDFQYGFSGRAFKDPLVVTVRNANGQPIADTMVYFTIYYDGGMWREKAIITKIGVRTDAQGRAQTTLIAKENTDLFGENLGYFRVEAFTYPIAKPATFTLQVKSNDPGRIDIESGNNQQTVTGSTFAQPLVVTVYNAGSQYDQIPSPLPDVVVKFAMESLGGTGSLTTSTVTTDENGQAKVMVRAGTVGRFRVRVTADGTSYEALFSLSSTTPKLYLPLLRK